MLTVRSRLIVKVGNGVTINTGLVTGEANPARTTQRATYDYWVTCQVSTSTFPRIHAAVKALVGDRFRRSTSHDLLKAWGSTWSLSFKVRYESMRFVWLASAGRPDQLPQVCSQLPNQYEG